eukprot:bmy_07242T0
MSPVQGPSASGSASHGCTGCPGGRSVTFSPDLAFPLAREAPFGPHWSFPLNLSSSCCLWHSAWRRRVPAPEQQSPKAGQNDRWRDLDRKCPLQIDQPSANIWECLPDKCQDGALWHREAATACAVTNLIKDLSLSDHNGNPSAPPSKRQCRSLSFSDEMSSCRTSWRPLGSKVWTPVEKRRCYSGGSVQRYSNGFSTMQRSSSFSLPSRANVLSSPYDQAGLHPRFGGQPCQGAPGSATCRQAGDIWGPDPSPVGGARLDMQRSLSCSHEQFSFAEYCSPSASSTPASTPELARRSSGLSRSRSQPCVLNDKKVGVKRRRPEEAQEQRPSLDLAKMAQKCSFPLHTC